MTTEKTDCQNCGTSINIDSANLSLICDKCGIKNELINFEEIIEETEINNVFSLKSKSKDRFEVPSVFCNSCNSEFFNNIQFNKCPYCGNTLTDKKSAFIFKPKFILPFKISKTEADKEFKSWINSLWFAPDELKNISKSDNALKGVFLPFWLFNFNTENLFEGLRRDDNYIPEYLNKNPIKNFKYSINSIINKVNGDINIKFRDLLIKGNNSLPDEYYEFLEPWDLTNLVPFKETLQGTFVTQVNQNEAKEAFEDAKKIMFDDICVSIRNEIGGDQQQIKNLKTSISKIKYRHVIFPVWIFSYNYKGKIYRFLINARNGQIHAERPISIIKIIGLIIPILIILILILKYIF